MLAGGLDPGERRGALRDVPAVGVDVASGVERPRDPGERPTKDPLRVALFAKRARAARDDRPNIPFGPTPVHAGLLDADGAGRWGMERDFGGRYVPETLMAALEQLEEAYDGAPPGPGLLGGAARAARALRRAADALYRADRLAEAVRERGGAPSPARRPRPAIPASGCTSSARTSPTRAPTRSTTRSARRC